MTVLRQEVRAMVAATAGIDRRFTNAQNADEPAVDQLMPVVYEQLRRLAKRHLAGQRRGHTLQTTDLVNEAYLKLAHRRETEWKDRPHFVAVASRAMRCVLVDYARGRCSAKRGGNPVRVSLTEAEQGAEPGSAEIIAVHDALTRLAGIDPRKSQIVELRYFGGLSVEEIAELIGLSARTVKREWRWARAWLYRELGDERPG
jgi:RNA polymerase sigma-70 factor, ECF subfamily